MVNYPDVVLRAVDLRNCCPFDLSLNNSSFSRVVIYKYQRLRQDIQLFCNGLHILALGLPVGLNSNKVIRLKTSVWMIKACDSVLFIVFRINSQKNSDVLLHLHIILELSIYLTKIGLLTDLNPVNAVVAYNSAPEGVVQVKHKALFVLAIN